MHGGALCSKGINSNLMNAPLVLVFPFKMQYLTCHSPLATCTGKCLYLMNAIMQVVRVLHRVGKEVAFKINQEL